MKNVIKNFFNKYKWHILIEIICIVINVYLMTMPSKLLGQMIDLLYDSTRRQ